MTIIDNDYPHLGGNIHGGDINTWNPTLWTGLLTTFAPRIVLDVGCGEGHAVQWFREQGVQAIGIDGLPLNVERAVTPIIQHDLTHGPYILRPKVDLVWCCEVVEHVDEEFLDNLLETLTNGHIIAMTHAVPGPGGHHHVNNQLPEYWISALATRGYKLMPHLHHWKDLAAQDGNTYFSKTGLLFRND